MCVFYSIWKSGIIKKLDYYSKRKLFSTIFREQIYSVFRSILLQQICLVMYIKHGHNCARILTADSTGSNSSFKLEIRIYTLIQTPLSLVVSKHPEDNKMKWQVQAVRLVYSYRVYANELGAWKRDKENVVDDLSRTNNRIAWC